MEDVRRQGEEVADAVPAVEVSGGCRLVGRAARGTEKRGPGDGRTEPEELASAEALVVIRELGFAHLNHSFRKPVYAPIEHDRASRRRLHRGRFDRRRLCLRGRRARDRATTRPRPLRLRASSLGVGGPDATAPGRPAENRRRSQGHTRRRQPRVRRLRPLRPRCARRSRVSAEGEHLPVHVVPRAAGGRAPTHARGAPDPGRGDRLLAFDAHRRIARTRRLGRQRL